ncbi:hypothetical protein [Oscillatoria salina]|nr:hypothetical protein [Oscillatoria salina]MBZ8182305.1 hypothetical protein [Oscillatoria salina IIICB1]
MRSPLKAKSLSCDHRFDYTLLVKKGYLEREVMNKQNFARLSAIAPEYSN